MCLCVCVCFLSNILVASEFVCLSALPCSVLLLLFFPLSLSFVLFLSGRVVLFCSCNCLCFVLDDVSCFLYLYPVAVLFRVLNRNWTLYP